MGDMPPSNTCLLALSQVHPKRHLDRFSRFCTAHGRASVPILYSGRPPPQNCSFPWGHVGPHLIHGSLGPPECSTQMASRSVQPFLQGSLLLGADRQTDRSTDTSDRPRYSIGNNRPHLHTVLRCGLIMYISTTSYGHNSPVNSVRFLIKGYNQYPLISIVMSTSVCVCVCVCVCLSVREDIFRTTRAIFTNF